MKLFEIESLPLLDKYKSAVQVAVEKYRKDRTAIYRGIRAPEDTTAPVSLVDPTKRSAPRRSANTENYYTLWIDNSSAWSQFPKRSYSLICTTDPAKAQEYGQLRFVVPLADTAIGICPESDIWYSFDTLPFGNNLRDLMDWMFYTFDNQDIPSSSRFMTYADLINSLKSINLDLLKTDPYSKLFKQHGAVGALEYILDPVKNNFKLTTWRQFSKQDDREVWLSAPCLYIDEPTFKELAHQ